MQREKSVEAPGHCEKWTPLLSFNASLSEDSDSDSEIYVLPDSEFQPKKIDSSQQKKHVNVSEEMTEEGFYPILGVIRHVAEERSGDTRELQHRADGCKSSRQWAHIHATLHQQVILPTLLFTVAV